MSGESSYAPSAKVEYMQYSLHTCIKACSTCVMPLCITRFCSSQSMLVSRHAQHALGLSAAHRFWFESSKHHMVSNLRVNKSQMHASSMYKYSSSTTTTEGLGRFAHYLSNSVLILVQIHASNMYSVLVSSQPHAHI